jgi:hypothetical protein
MPMTIDERQPMPFKVVICDRDATAARMLDDAVARVDPNIDRSSVAGADHLLDALEQGIAGAIFIDPFSLGLDEATTVIFHVRETYPWITFVLYMDVAEAERTRADFYRGKRSRFSHYYRLDKGTPLLAFDREVESTLQLAKRWALKHSYAVAVQRTISTRGAEAPLPDAEALVSLDERLYSQKNSVFLSHRFAETEFVDGLQRLLEQNGFVVVKGDSANTFVSQAVLQRIKDSEFVLCLITRAEEKTDGTFATSGWLLEEKGAALAFGKPLVLMVEDGVTDIGGLQGDWQRIHFTAKGFLKAALQAVDQLKSYSGRQPLRGAG